MKRDESAQCRFYVSDVTLIYFIPLWLPWQAFHLIGTFFTVSTIWRGIRLISRVTNFTNRPTQVCHEQASNGRFVINRAHCLARNGFGYYLHCLVTHAGKPIHTIEYCNSNIRPPLSVTLPQRTPHSSRNVFPSNRSAAIHQAIRWI